MIESIKIASCATFVGDAQVLDKLSTFNFIFGSNGSGKTTISRVIANPDKYSSCSVNWKSSLDLQTMVYNRDFVETNFKDLKGVFTLGDNVDALEKIKEAKIGLASHENAIIGMTVTLQGADGKGGKLADLQASDTDFERKCWEQKKKHDAKFMAALEGFRKSAEKFKGKILQECASNKSTLLSLGELEIKAATVFGEAPTKEPILPDISFDLIQTYESDPIMKKRVLGSTDVDIAEMIKKLGNSDWVRAGRSYYDVNDRPLLL